MARKDADSTRITITIDKNIYGNIKEISKRMGISPSTWVTMICTSKVNDIELSIISKKEGEL